jgi:hypothetical protein
MYVAMLAYSQSKLANVLFAKELSRNLEGKCDTYLITVADEKKFNNAHVCVGTGVHVYSLHPGIVRTELTRTVDKVFFPGAWFLFRFFVYPWVKNPEQGAQTTLHCSIDEKAGEQTGLYYRLDDFRIFFIILFVNSFADGSNATFECTTVFFLSNCKVKEPSSLAKNVELAKKLWDKSVEMVGIKDYDMFNCEDTLPEPLKDV